MAIRKPIVLTWGGVDQKIIVNMQLIERIDNEVNILKLVSSNEDNVSIVKISKLIWILLEESGLEIAWDDVYQGLGDSADMDALQSVMQEITPMLLPNFKSVGKKKRSARKK